jgi:hypothetical protein
MTGRILAMVLGIWLTVAPSLLGSGPTARTHDWIVGPLIASIACVAIWPVTRGLRRLNVVLGLWLVAAPWLLGFSPPAAIVNAMACGVAIAALSLHRGRLKHRFGGGWSSLFRREPAETQQTP